MSASRSLKLAFLSGCALAVMAGTFATFSLMESSTSYAGERLQIVLDPKTGAPLEQRVVPGRGLPEATAGASTRSESHLDANGTRNADGTKEDRTRLITSAEAQKLQLASLSVGPRSADAGSVENRKQSETPPPQAQEGKSSQQAESGERKEDHRSWTVQSGDTAAEILTKAGVDPHEVQGAIAALGELFDPRHLRPGHEISIETASDGSLAAVVLKTSSLESYRVEPEGEEFVAQVEEAPTETVQQIARGAIEGSFILSAQRAGAQQQILAEAVNLLSHRVDFQRDIHPGNSFELIYEVERTEDGAAIAGGRLLKIELGLSDRDLVFYSHEHADGTRGFYAEDGSSIRRLLMRTPVDGARLSSGFGMRKHPILGYGRMHKGVDFAAATGTRIYAAGDGVIERIGRNGGFGNYIRIKHSGSYKTAYAHMNSFARGLKKGSKVTQGQVIGRVGSTGQSTGPHLHYEVLKNGKQIDPQKVGAGLVQQLEGKELARLKDTIARTERLRAELDENEKPRVIAKN